MLSTSPKTDLQFKEIDLMVLSRLIGHMGTPYAVYLGEDPGRSLPFPSKVPQFFSHREIYEWATRGAVLFNFSNENLLDGSFTKLGVWIIQGAKHTEIMEDCCICNAVQNPDGTLRWVYPSYLKDPLFLTLYNSSGWKAQAFKRAVQATYRLGLGHRFGDQKFVIGSWNQVSLSKEIARQKNTDWAAFTGTKGATRKAVVYLPNEEGYFYKKPLAPQAITALQKERQALESTDFTDIPYLNVPKLKSFSSGISVSDVRPDYSLPIQGNAALPNELLADFAQLQFSELVIGQTTFYKEIKDQLDQLNAMEAFDHSELDAQKVSRLIQYLTILFERQDASAEVPCSFSHGDFTPWNMYSSGNRISLYDFEFAAIRPLFYDLFHFHFQPGILVNRLSLNQILSNVEASFAAGQMKPVERWTGKKREFYNWYLLHQVSYYLLRFLHQSPLHKQAHWLVDTWSEAITAVMTAPIEDNVVFN